MNKHLLTLSLGITSALIGTSVLANTGTINFEGRITSSTCPIEVVNPGDGQVGNLVKMGSIEASRFTQTGQEYDGKSFILRVSGGPGCNLDPADNTATVTFNGTTDTSGEYFSVEGGSDSAKGVVIALKDKKGAAIMPGTASSEYDLNDTGSTDMLFNAYYRSIAPTVTAGTASTDVQFVVAIN